ncbi:YacL family protein [Psychromonas sp. PT13]|uniref:YacL family protein n=1 Tax=Psychromonas sp. PT13 TaxID=3439547 RepID=UPI003EBEE27C
MEFEFRKHFISESATVKISMGHEAFATWLEQEGQQASWVKKLLEQIALLQQHQINEIKMQGSEFSLLLTEGEAQVANHSILNNQEELGLDEDMNFYDLEIQASCGLEDFVNLLESWLAFID